MTRYTTWPIVPAAVAQRICDAHDYRLHHAWTDGLTATTGPHEYPRRVLCVVTDDTQHHLNPAFLHDACGRS